MKAFLIGIVIYIGFVSLSGGASALTLADGLENRHEQLAQVHNL